MPKSSSRPANREYVKRRAVVFHPVEYARYLLVLARCRTANELSSRYAGESARLANEAVDRGRRFYRP